MKKSEPRHELDVVLNPNCSEAVMKVPGMPLHDALTMLEGIGIHASEIGMDRFFIDYKPASDDFDTAFMLRDKNNLAIPYDPHDPKDARWETIDPIFKDIEELLEDDSIDDDEHDDISLSRDWLYERGYIKIAARGDDWVISARNPEGPRCRPTMLAIEKLFNQQWDMPEDIQERDYNPWKAKVMKLDKTPDQHVWLNPNCSEIVLELPGMTREAALAKLREIGIIEVSIPGNHVNDDDDDDDRIFHVLADKGNPNCPDFTSRSTIQLNDTSARSECWRSRGIVKDLFHYIALARREPGRGDPAPRETEMTPENGKMLVDIATELKRPKPSFEKVNQIIETWPGFTIEGKMYLMHVLSGRSFLAEDSDAHPTMTLLERSRVLEIIGKNVIDGKSIDDIATAIHQRYPGLDAPWCYFILGGNDRSLFPTAKKIEKAFNREWKGSKSGGNIAAYEEWEEEEKATGIAIQMRSRGKTDEQIVDYLQETFPYGDSDHLIDKLKRGEPLSMDIIDCQDDDGRAKRDRYCRFDQ